ncbi:hypothetical protein [Bradyrhizobium neotropicale]|uniref:hypothetical protein n=1 Tax=Bradyrhizobium neotropicale TaxID=1497615 RepID=UPI001AD64E41|nr:hypothetical protein [Bradyrhizobium neotropicale]MBO4228521.1 hypothetical protein [Bradyrhizobium neotropicale]
MMLEEEIKLHRFAGISPEQFFTKAGRHREAMMAADESMVIRCFGDSLAGFVHDHFHAPPPMQREPRGAAQLSNLMLVPAFQSMKLTASEPDLADPDMLICKRSQSAGSA